MIAASTGLLAEGRRWKREHGNRHAELRRTLYGSYLGSLSQARHTCSVALGVALGGCLADVAVLRAEPDVFGPVASDPTVSRLIDSLAAAGPKALTAVRSARAEARSRVWELAGAKGPSADGHVTVDIDGVLVLAHSEEQDATATWKKTFGHHPLVAFVDHG